MITNLRNGMRARRRWLPWLLVGLVLGVVNVCVVGIVALRSFNPFILLEHDVSDIPVEEIERVTDISLPPSTSNINSRQQGFQDYIMHVRFEMAAGDLPTFLASSHFTQTLSTTEVPSAISRPYDRPWWTPLNAQQFQAGEASFVHPTLGVTLYQYLLVDTTDPKRYIVYFVSFNI